MGKVPASITMSIDGYVTGPDDGPARAWVRAGSGCTTRCSAVRGPMTRGRPVRRDQSSRSGSTLSSLASGLRLPAGTCTRQPATGAARTRGRPLLHRTHRTEEQPDGDDFVFVDGLAKAIERAEQAAGDKDVSLGGGADVIRQALELGLVDDLSIVIAPVILGGGKQLFEGFTHDIELEHQGVRQSQYATIIDYAVTRS